MPNKGEYAMHWTEVKACLITFVPSKNQQNLLTAWEAISSW